MKKITSVLFVMYLVLYFNCGCKKDTANAAKSPVGNWKWFATYEDIPFSDSNPLTPKNTGNQEVLIFNTDYTFRHLINNVVVDSGTYSYGHGTYTNLSNYTFSYDSILYFHKNMSIAVGVDFYGISSDTLYIGAGDAGQFSSYSTPYGGSIWWVKQ